MLAIGWLLPREEVREVVQHWPTVLGGTLVQYTSMPLLAYAMGRLFQLDEQWMVGIVVAGCVPGAMASNVLTMVARGTVS
jgi:BASS family bile acid:Na+ symporter